MEHLIATWVVKVWQNRRLGEYAPTWDPVGDHSPNSLFAASFAQSGFPMDIPSPDLYYRLLPEHQVKRIDPRRGVKVKGLWYDGPALDAYKGLASNRGGRRKQQWVIHREPRDRRTVYFQDPATHEWHPLAWTGLPPDGTDLPAFGDLRVEELLTRVRQAGLKPRTDAELLPALLKMIGAVDPVADWPTRMTKARRIRHAREAAQAAAAAADRPPEADPPRTVFARLPPSARPSPGQNKPAEPPGPWTPSADGAAKNASATPGRVCLPGWAPPTAPTASSSCPPRTTATARTARTPDRLSPTSARNKGSDMADDHRHNGASAAPLPFLRFGPRPDRTTCTGWQEWQLTRGLFVPALACPAPSSTPSPRAGAACTTCTAPRHT